MGTNERLNKLSQQAVEKWGEAAADGFVCEQLLHTVQELTELSLAIQQYRYGKVDVSEVKYELADVAIMLNQLMLLLDISNDEISELVNTKLDKLEKALIK